MKIHIYKDSKSESPWRLIATNGKTIADCGEGYSSKSACKDGIARLKGAAIAPVIEDD
jgi:uncharacterized protein YegP (UPF0339 family)